MYVDSSVVFKSSFENLNTIIFFCMPSHIKDTTDYLKKMENLAIPENIKLVSMDATSLYTSIPHDYGIAACRKI
jgi:hypothetical protein